MKLPTHKALAAARLYAVEKAPYFAQAILAMQPHEVPNGTYSPTGTFAITARGVLLYEPAALERWSAQEAGAVLIHEVSHWLRDHAGRAAALSISAPEDRDRWNLACDAEINDDLIDMQLPLPDGGGIQPKTLGCPNGRTAEEYYAHLRQQGGAPKKKPGFGGQESCGSGAGGNADAEEALGLGSGGGGKDGEGEDGDGEGSDAPPGHAADVAEAVRQATAVAISDAAQRGIGKVPAGLQRWAEARTKPPHVPWTQKLARVGRAVVAHRAGASDYAYTRVARRQGGLGFGAGAPIAPALIAKTPRVAVAVDTSGSMGKAEIERAVIEAEAVMKAVGSTIEFLSCDCAVHSVVRVRTARELIAALKGGGGTSFVPVFDEVARWRQKPDVLVFITDGGGDAPARAPKGLSVIWVLVGKHRCRPYARGGGQCSWGEFIEVDD